MRITSSSPREFICQIASMMFWPAIASVACRPASIHTNARPSAASSFAFCASTRPRASVTLISRSRSRFARFFGELMTIISMRWP